MRKNHIYLTTSLFIISLFFSSCASMKGYFNTFYNAEQYFIKAEKIRIEAQGNKLPNSALDNYQKVIEKAQIVLKNNPEFKFRKNALLLIGQSYYYKNELQDAITTFSMIRDDFPDDYMDYEFWSAMIKWKQGKVQPAINELKALAIKDLDLNTKAKIYNAIAEIYVDQEMVYESMDFLEKAAENIADPIEKGQIYYRISDISFERKEYNRALSAYQQVIKNSQTQKHIQESHLRIVQIYRLQEKLGKATDSIKNMLIDDRYQSIFGDLELELIKLYNQQNMHKEANNRLESFPQDYPRTKISAEAYYMLGNVEINEKWDLDTALQYFGMVQKEYSQSRFIKPASLRIKEINIYNSLIGEYNDFLKVNTKVDSTGNSILMIKNQDDFAKILYGIAELESFHFSRVDSGLIYLDQLIKYSPNSLLYTKGLYAKSIILDQLKRKSESRIIKNQIISNYPQTDYAQAIIKSDSSYKIDNLLSVDMLIEAENEWQKDPVLAMENYREIVDADTVSDISAKAAYFLAYHYDYFWVEPDSALKYYKWLMKYHNRSDQAKHSINRITFLNAVLNDTLLSK